MYTFSEVNGLGGLSKQWHISQYTEIHGGGSLSFKRVNEHEMREMRLTLKRGYSVRKVTVAERLLHIVLREKFKLNSIPSFIGTYQQCLRNLKKDNVEDIFKQIQATGAMAGVNLAYSQYCSYNVHNGWVQWGGRSPCRQGWAYLLRPQLKEWHAHLFPVYAEAWKFINSRPVMKFEFTPHKGDKHD
jgi:hypothetical protein